MNSSETTVKVGDKVLEVGDVVVLSWQGYGANPEEHIEAVTSVLKVLNKYPKK